MLLPAQEVEHLEAMDRAEEGAVKIERGKLPEERLEFWLQIQGMLDSGPGRAYLALMQRELGSLAVQMQVQKDKDAREELYQRWLQMTWVCNYPSYVAGKVNLGTKEVQRKRR